MVAMTVVLALAVAAPGSAQSPDYSWPPRGTEYLSGMGNMGFAIINKGVPYASLISPQTFQGIPPTCPTLDDPRCAVPAKELGWRVTRAAPVCSDALDWEECIQGMSVITSTGAKSPSTFLGYANTWTFAADPERGLPTGAAMGLWSDPLSNDPAAGYAVVLGGMMVKRPGETYSLRNPFRFSFFGAEIFPYRVEPMEGRNFTDCLWWGQGKCGVRIDFESGVRIELSFLMNKDITGWMSGRLYEPAVDIVRARGNLNSVTVAASPVDVAMVAASVPVSEATPAMVALQREIAPPLPLDSVISANSDSGEFAFERLRAYGAAIGDTALKVIPTWSITSMVGTLKKCARDDSRLVGLVTTNATAYSSGPPTFKDGVLSYSVGALHYTPSGRPFRGSYDLVMRTETARCLYGFDKAPLRAEIQVVAEDGEPQVATTAISERDGWIHLAAYNFTFSNPTIKARLYQDGRSKTITCKLGRTTITVTGVKPKCPPGWKQVGRAS